MLYRKVMASIEDHLKNNSEKILLIDGAHQIGKTYLLRYVVQQNFSHFLELNMSEDKLNTRMFSNINSVDDFFLTLSKIAGDHLALRDKTLVLIDDIQVYPHLFSLLPLLLENTRYTFVVCGCLADLSPSYLPLDSNHIRHIQMHPLDFEEFLIANGFNSFAINVFRQKLITMESLDENMHRKIMDLFHKYLLVGGMPAAVECFLEEKNIQLVRRIHQDILASFRSDTITYDAEHNRQTNRIFELIPANLQKKKKRIVIKDIAGKKGKTFADYEKEFSFLQNAGFVLETKASSNPSFPLASDSKLMKHYFCDVGLLSYIFFGKNIRDILDRKTSMKLAALYENLVACELFAHGHHLYYFDKRGCGEVDFLIEDSENEKIIPIQVNAGKNYSVYSARKFFTENNAIVDKYIVFSNNRPIKRKDKTLYLPTYMVAFV